MVNSDAPCYGGLFIGGLTCNTLSVILSSSKADSLEHTKENTMTYQDFTINLARNAYTSCLEYPCLLEETIYKVDCHIVCGDLQGEELTLAKMTLKALEALEAQMEAKGYRVA